VGEEQEALFVETISFTFGLCYKYILIIGDDPENSGDGIGTIGVLSWFIIRRISEPDWRIKIEEAQRVK